MRARLISENIDFKRTGDSKGSMNVGIGSKLDGKLETAPGAEYLLDKLKEKEIFVHWSWDSPDGIITMEDAEIYIHDDYCGEVIIEFNNADIIRYDVRETNSGDTWPDWESSIEINSKEISKNKDEILDYLSANSWFLGILNFYKNWYINKRNK